MILLVDAGNTRVKWRCIDKVGVKLDFGEVDFPQLTYEYLNAVSEKNNVSSVYLSSVGQDAVVTVFREWASGQGLNLCVVSSQKSICGINFSYKEFGRLGVDRCLAMIGAYIGKSVLVVDAGSAITADYINDEGDHLGGYILPGYQMSRQVLLSKTSKIGVLADFGDFEPGRSTESCVNNGFALMYRSLLMGFIEYAEKFKVEEVVITGGDAELLAGLLSESVCVRENLVLDGLQKYSLY